MVLHLRIVSLYYSVVGSLQYMAFTRPNISFAVNHVCQYIRCPRLPHWITVKYILRYLNHTRHFGLIFQLILFILYLPFLMQIGTGVLMIDILQVVFVSILGII